MDDVTKKLIDNYFEAADAEQEAKSRKEYCRKQLLERMPEIEQLSGDMKLQGFSHGLILKRTAKFKLIQDACKESKELNEALDRGEIPEIGRWFKFGTDTETFKAVKEFLKTRNASGPADVEYVLTKDADTIRKSVYAIQRRLGVQMNDLMEDTGPVRFYLNKTQPGWR